MGRHIEQISATEAFGRATTNAQRRYPTPQAKGNRLYPIASPVGQPTFQITQDETFFTIGSCFARNIESALITAGMDVTSREVNLGIVGDSRGFAPNFFNKYSVHSIYNDLKWALERDSFPGAEVLYHIDGKDWYADLQMGIPKLKFPVDDILAFRTKYLDVITRVAVADVVVITLGYAETWFDTKLGVYLNTSPPLALVKAEPDRFEFRVLSYDDILSCLHKIRILLEKHRTKPLRMLLTVSPVPLQATFRDMDVLIANTYSKSVQRAAIDAFVSETTLIDYFPSYEFVTLSNPNVAWKKGDYRHVSSDLVALIMENVMDQYIVDENRTKEVGKGESSVAMSLRLMADAQEHEALIEAAHEAYDLVHQRADLMVLFAQAHAHLGKVEQALDLLISADKLPSPKGAPLEALIALICALGRFGTARTYLREHEQRYPTRAGFRSRIMSDYKFE